MWLKRSIERIENALDGGGAAQERAVNAVLERRASYPSDDALLDALLELMPAEQPLCNASLACIARALRVRPSGTSGDDDIDEASQLRFWCTIAERFPLHATGSTFAHTFAHACCADAMLAVGDEDAALARFLDAAELEPELVPEFGDAMAPIAERAGGDAWLRFQVVDLRARINDPEQADDIRERYSELLSEHRHDSAALGRIRPLGELLNRLTDAELLPRAFVRRGD